MAKSTLAVAAFLVVLTAAVSSEEVVGGDINGSELTNKFGSFLSRLLSASSGQKEEVIEELPFRKGYRAVIASVAYVEGGEANPVQSTPAASKYSLYNIKVNFFQALQMCLQMKKRLATIRKEDEWSTLVAMIKTSGFDGNETDYWTAGSDLGQKGLYVWMSTGQPVNYTNFYCGEPSHHVWEHTTERCIELCGDYSYKMNDKWCESEQYFICEENF